MFEMSVCAYVYGIVMPMIVWRLRYGYHIQCGSVSTFTKFGMLYLKIGATTEARLILQEVTVEKFFVNGSKLNPLRSKLLQYELWSSFT